MFIRQKPELIREQLLGRIAQSVDAVSFTLLSAPPASGKTTVLQQFRQRRPESCAELTPGAPAWPDAGVAIIQNAERWDQDQLAALLQHVERGGAPGVRVVISANRPLDHLLPVARLRRQVIEFGPEELGLSRHEVRGFLTPDAHQFIEIRDLNRIYKRIGGWIGAWNIVEAMAENGATLAEIAGAMSGALPVFRQFFHHHLQGLDEALRDVVVRIGHFDEITPGLISVVLPCDPATGFELAQALPAGCPFLLRQHDGATIRPYPLFQDYIGQLSRKLHPQRHRSDLIIAAESARNSSDWLGAAMCFIRAGERSAATALLAEHTEELITNRGEVVRFRALTRTLQNDNVLEAALASELALGAIFAGAFGHARSLIERAPARTAEEAARQEAISLCISFGLDALDEVVAKAPAWLERRQAANPRFTSIVAVSLFWSAMEMLDTVTAERALTLARSLTQHANAGLISDWLAVCEAFLYWEQGRVADADSLLGRTATAGPSNHTMNHLRAALAWERGDTPLCRHLLSSSLHRGARHSVAETAFLGWTCAASLYFTEGQPERALRLLGEAEATMMTRHGERARQMMRAARARLLLQVTGEADAAQELLGQNVLVQHVPVQHVAGKAMRVGGLRGDASPGEDLPRQHFQGEDRPPGPRGRYPALEETHRLVQARSLVHLGQQRRAILLLQPIVSRALKQGRMRVWGEACIIYAGALARLGETERASRTAWQAICQLVAGGGRRAILAERLMLAPLLDELLRRSALEARDGRLHALLVELGRASGLATAPLRIADETEGVVVVQLTETERKILTFAGRGFSNNLIADHLLIKVSTVKWHLHNVFEKFGVRSRTAAIAHARKVGVPLD